MGAGGVVGEGRSDPTAGRGGARLDLIGFVLSIALSIGLLGAMSALGIAVLWRAAGFLTRLERGGYGAPLGMILATLPVIPLASLFGLGAGLVVAVALASAVVAALLLIGPPQLAGPSGHERRARLLAWRPGNASPRLGRPDRITLLAAAVIGLFALRWAILWVSALTFDDGGLMAGHVNIWGDWPVHLGVVSSFVYGDNFPPEHPRFLGWPFAYHYLSDLTAAMLVPLGLEPGAALQLHSWVSCLAAIVALFAFARRMLADRASALVVVVLFLLGGGLGWVVTASRMVETGDPIGVLTTLAWDFRWKTELNFQWVNMFYGFWMSQRAFLYGMPLAFLIISTLLEARRRDDLGRAGEPAGGGSGAASSVGAPAVSEPVATPGVRQRELRGGPATAPGVGGWLADVRLWVLAGLFAALLPLSHLATMLALAIALPIAFLLSPSRGWVVFGVVWFALAFPQVVLMQGGEPGALSAARLQVGWVADADPWIWFWLKNLGWLLPVLLLALVGVALLRRRTWDPFPAGAWPILLGLLSIFVVANIVALQPWDWDNHKILVYFFLAAILIVTPLLMAAWRTRRVLLRGLVVAAILMFALSGVLEDVGQLLGQSRYRMLDTAQVKLAALVREETNPRAIFVTGMQNHDPVAMLSGRRILVGFRDWLWTEGIPYEGRQAEVRSIYRFESGTEELLRSYGIDYVVIGPDERTDLGADEDAFRERYPVAIETDGYRVYDVRG